MLVGMGGAGWSRPQSAVDPLRQGQSLRCERAAVVSEAEYYYRILGEGRQGLQVAQMESCDSEGQPTIDPRDGSLGSRYGAFARASGPAAASAASGGVRGSWAARSFRAHPGGAEGAVVWSAGHGGGGTEGEARFTWQQQVLGKVSDVPPSRPSTLQQWAEKYAYIMPSATDSVPGTRRPQT